MPLNSIEYGYVGNSSLLNTLQENLGKLQGKDAKAVVISTDGSIVPAGSRIKATQANNVSTLAVVKHALTNAFGEAIADRALDSQLGVKGQYGKQPLSSQQLRTILDSAEKAYTQLFIRSLTKTPSLRGVDPQVMRDALKNPKLTNAQYMELRKTGWELAKSMEALSSFPLDNDSRRDCIDTLDARMAALTKCKQEIDQWPDGTTGRAEFSARLESTLKTMTQLKAELQDPTGFGQDDKAQQTKLYNHALGQWTRAAAGVIQQLTAKYPKLSPEARQGLADLAKSYEKKADSYDHDTWMLPDDPLKALSRMKDDLAAQLQADLKSQHSISVPWQRTLGKMMTESWKGVLEHDPTAWQVIDKEVAFSAHGTDYIGRSEIVPASKLGGIFDQKYAGLGGVMCARFTEGTHAVNLARSSFTLETGGKTKEVFSGLRHGVHSAIDIPGGKARDTANAHRAQEVVTAALMGKPELLKQALEHPTQPVTLDMTSVSLLTPDGFRSGHSDEQSMMIDQMMAWARLSKQPVSVEVQDPKTKQNVTVQVKVSVAIFNFAVNEGAVKYGKVVGSLMGWDTISYLGLNDIGMNQLQHRVEAYLAKKPANAKIVTKLWNQTVDILKNEQERSDLHDAYKAASRIAVLTYQMGDTPCWNCKSGKDRTGEMDVECKFLSTQIETTGDVPDPGVIRDKDERTMFRKFALGTGNLEMQRYNTGVPGFKTGSVDSIAERIGTPAAKAKHTGWSHAVKA